MYPKILITVTFGPMDNYNFILYSIPHGIYNLFTINVNDKIKPKGKCF